MSDAMSKTCLLKFILPLLHKNQFYALLVIFMIINQALYASPNSQKKFTNKNMAFLNQQNKANKLKKLKAYAGKGILKIAIQTTQPVEKISNWDFKLKGTKHLVIELPHVKSTLSKDLVRLNHQLLGQIHFRRSTDKLWIILSLPRQKNFSYLVEKDKANIFVYIFQSERYKIKFITQREGKSSYWAKMLQSNRNYGLKPTNSTMVNSSMKCNCPNIVFSINSFFPKTLQFM